MTGIETNRSSTESGTVTKPVFLIGNGSESGLNQNSDGKAGFIDENENKVPDSVALMMENAGNEDGVKSEFGTPAEGPPKLSLLNNKTMFVDVIVNNAVSPVNFSVQNYRQSNNLKKLEKTMTLYYNEVLSRTPGLGFKDLGLHGYYALKYSPPSDPDSAQKGGKGKGKKERWVRCQIMKPFNETMPILTHLIDHGFYYTTEPICIQPLKRAFLVMPVQSYEARLNFVESTKFQFTPEDCHRFHKQVEGKAFCGILVQKGLSLSPSSTEKTDSKINIILIDTSGEKDHYVHQDFVPKKLR